MQNYSSFVIQNCSSNNTVWYWHKNRHVNQWNRIKSPEINPCIYGQLIFDKKAKNNQWGKNSLFNKYCWKTGYSHAELWNWIPLSYTTHKNNSKGIKDLNAWLETIKILEENTGGNFLDISHDNDFFLIWHQKQRQ